MAWEAAIPAILSAVGSIGGGVASGLAGGGGGVTTRGALAPAGQPQRTLIQGLRDLFGAGAGVTTAGVGQLGMVAPELWRELGFEPEMEDRTAELAAVQQEVDQLTAQVAEAKTKISKVRRRPASEKRNRRLAKLRRQKKLLVKDLSRAEASLTDLRSEPIRITGLTPLAAGEVPATSYRSAENAARQMIDLTLQQAIEALQGEVETDPTLLREFDEAEGRLHEKLRRQLGPGYETSSAGIEALTKFQRSKREAIAGYTRDLAASLTDRALSGEATLSDLVSARLGQGVFLPQQTMASGLTLGQATTPGFNIGALSQAERQLTHLTPGSAAGGSLLQALQTAGVTGAIGQQLGGGIADWYAKRRAQDAATLAARRVPGTPIGTYMT